MKNRVITVLLAILFCFGIIGLSSCDFGIFDYNGDDNFFEGLDVTELLKEADIKDLLNTKQCYEQLNKELKFMIEGACYKNERLAASQAYTIMITYGMADLSVNPSSLNTSVLNTKAALFNEIRLINLYSNNITAGVISMYDQEKLKLSTEMAIVLCESLINSFSHEQ